MHPHYRGYDPNNPWAFQENPSPPPNRPMPPPFLIHSTIADVAGYASYLSNRVYTNFPHTDDSIPTPFSQTPINLSPTSINLSQTETFPETPPPNDGPSASKPIKKRSHKKKTEAEKALESAKRKQKRWVVNEELALARAWLQQSQHPTLGIFKYFVALNIYGFLYNFVIY
ncbi:hypothetical protein HanPI659440_Chr08g0308651 [Helianthus annuus]|nr:hypothetical protein HanPI659440_Chr08g0308651 [Helianthus annuus]